MELTLGEETITNFKQAVQQVSMVAQAKLPHALHGAVQRGTALVLNRHVWLGEDGRHAQVLSADGQTWLLVNGNCTCMEAPQAPEGLCAHRLAVGIYRRASELLTSSTAPVQPAAAEKTTLPEAPASVNVRVKVQGHEVQWTLRDSSEDRLAARLEALLTRYPEAVCQAKGREQASAPAQPTPEGWCLIHQTQMTRQSNDRGSWWSHKTADGWCRGKAPKH